MRKLVTLLFSILILSTTLSSLSYGEPLNLSCAQNQVVNYYSDLSSDSAYIKDVNNVVVEAEKYLQTRVSPNPADNAHLALVLDIDDTSLSNYLSIKRDYFSNSPELIDARYHAANAPAIQPILRLFNEARAKGVSVFFISVRKPLASNPNEDLLPFTIENLQHVGYANWTKLFIPQGEDLKLPSATWKTKIREMLVDGGYDIILNIGDQDSDLVGGYADKTDKIPNYLYSTSPTPCGSAKSCFK